MPTPSQIRAARGLLNWSQSDLAGRAGVTEATIRNCEKDDASPNSKTSDKILRALEGDIEFLEGDGLRRREQKVQKLDGREGFKAFIWDVFDTVKKYGGEICVSNVDETKFTQALGKEEDDAYMIEMQKLSNHQSFEFKILIKEGDRNFVASNYAQYKWIPDELFFSVPFYVYGEKLAFIILNEEKTSIYIFENADIASAQKVQFNLMWKQAKNPDIS